MSAREIVADMTHEGRRWDLHFVAGSQVTWRAENDAFLLGLGEVVAKKIEASISLKNKARKKVYEKSDVPLNILISKSQQQLNFAQQAFWLCYICIELAHKNPSLRGNVQVESTSCQHDHQPQVIQL